CSWTCGSPTELCDINFLEMWAWPSMFRARNLGRGFSVIDHGLRFRLFGIGELLPIHQMVLPWDENDMILWNHRSDIRKPLGFRIFSPRGVNFRDKRCWQLVSRILEIELIKNNLYIFVRAMYKPQLTMYAQPVLVEAISALRCWIGSTLFTVYFQASVATLRTYTYNLPTITGYFPNQ
ncbi:uncharacterized protein N7500_005875, partial [Penicillium coprophilum]|uniref:uncharacterized protein n=1 Tax=Penicillium coprophilum TaxID=36646 RepID=UPI00238FA4B7